MRKLLPLLVAGFLLGGVVLGEPLMHERLRVKNTFTRPEEVVAYYCSRDASGFIWSGMLDAERRAFTLWEDPPQQDTFFIASKYEVLPPEVAAGEARVQVRYLLVALGDIHGTRMPVHPEERVVTFQLKKTGGSWKIARPEAREIAPIVLDAKFR
ncbi:MAG: hypothetical protein NDJ90_01430 [Oligoflexia bacterium]|nr:hypothetical protein [Oligoflexia bacterium]